MEVFFSLGEMIGALDELEVCIMTIERMLKATDDHDIEWFEENVHQEYIYVDDFSMLTREDWFLALKQFFDDKIEMNNKRKILIDESDITSFQFYRSIDNVEHRITNVHLLKDGKIWRHIVNRVPLK